MLKRTQRLGPTLPSIANSTRKQGPACPLVTGTTNNPRDPVPWLQPSSGIPYSDLQPMEGRRQAPRLLHNRGACTTHHPPDILTTTHNNMGVP